MPGFSIVLNVLLTRKLPTFLSRFNEISGGCETITPVSGSFCNILKLLRTMAFTGLFVRVKYEGEGNSVILFPLVTFVVLTVKVLIEKLVLYVSYKKIGVAGPHFLCPSLHH